MGFAEREREMLIFRILNAKIFNVVELHLALLLNSAGV